MNIYLAGKIGYKDWRHAIVNGLEYANQDFDHDYYIEDWRVMNGAILGEHNYTGPFFISRGHGESHGDNTHGCDLYGHCIEDMAEIKGTSCPDCAGHRLIDPM